jgi:hypothetical protein
MSDGDGMKEKEEKRETGEKAEEETTPLQATRFPSFQEKKPKSSQDAVVFIAWSVPRVCYCITGVHVSQCPLYLAV